MAKAAVFTITYQIWFETVPKNYNENLEIGFEAMIS